MSHSGSLRSYHHCSVHLWVNYVTRLYSVCIYRKFFIPQFSQHKLPFWTVLLFLKIKDVAVAGRYLVLVRKGTRNVKHSPICAVNLLLFMSPIQCLYKMFFTDNTCICDCFLLHLTSTSTNRTYMQLYISKSLIYKITNYC